MKCEQVPTLGHLPCLKALEIWGMYDVTCIGVEFYGMCSNVLFPSLRTLTIKYLDELVEWKDALEVTSASVVFPCLEELTIGYCYQLRSAPCHFPFLQKLEIDGVNNMAVLERISSNLTTLKSAKISTKLTSVPEQLFCTSLQSLKITNCEELSYIPDTLQPLIFLEELTIEYCPKLKCFPRIQDLQRLRSLIIWSCGFEVLTPQLQLCPSLSQLRIKFCPDLKSLPNLQEFHSLADLEIFDCHNLTSIPDLQGCHSLAQLEIYKCDNIKSIPDLGKLCFLTSLNIASCSNIRHLPEGPLKCLKSLTIGGYNEELHAFPSLNFIQQSRTTLEYLHVQGWAKLNSLPGEIQHFTALQTLVINGFDGIETLPEWLGDLSSLKKLKIWSCNNLMYLPTTHLIKLEELNILYCSKLKERCAEGSGAEWLKIAHIPKITIR
nr:putative disease resistance protein rpp1 [Quercus suber]